MVIILIVAAVYIAKSTATAAAGGSCTQTYATLAKTLDGSPTVKPTVGDGAAAAALVNTCVLGQRFAGFLGPFGNSCPEPEGATRLAVSAGVRAFVLDIDWLDDCPGEPMPTLVVRDTQGRIRAAYSTAAQRCPSASAGPSLLTTVAASIVEQAFAPAATNAADPVIVVLNIARLPAAAKTRQTTAYLSKVAKALAPLAPFLLRNSPDGGKFYRQQQEGRLITNPLSDYAGTILLFCNADTTGFRDSKLAALYEPSEDLDYMVHLRLWTTQSAVGATAQAAGEVFGLLQTTQDFLTVPPDRTSDVADTGKLRWTICVEADPSAQLDQATYSTLYTTFGVNCVPVALDDPAVAPGGLLKSDDTFGATSYIAKPAALQYEPPAPVIPAEVSEKVNANGGLLRSPTLGQ